MGALLGTIAEGAAGAAPQRLPSCCSCTRLAITLAAKPAEQPLSPAVRKAVEKNANPADFRHRQGWPHHQGMIITWQALPHRLQHRPLLRRLLRSPWRRRGAREDDTPAPTIARRLKEAQNTAAMLTTFNEVDMSAVMALRNPLQGRVRKEARRQARLHVLLREGRVQALKDVPGRQRRDRRRRHRLQELLPHRRRRRHRQGPGRSGACAMPTCCRFADIEKTIADYGQEAPATASSTIDDLQGGTFTITNGGVYGSLMSTPILNPPQSGILGMHKIQERPIVVERPGRHPPDDVSRALLRSSHRRRQGSGDLPGARQGRRWKTRRGCCWIDLSDAFLD